MDHILVPRVLQGDMEVSPLGKAGTLFSSPCLGNTADHISVPLSWEDMVVSLEGTGVSSGGMVVVVEADNRGDRISAPLS